MGSGIDEQLRRDVCNAMLTPEEIYGCYHRCGRSELAFLVFKEFVDQRLPFEWLRPNASFYYLMCIAFFLYETFKKIVCAEVVPITFYPNTLRRKVIDIVAKLVCRGGMLRLKVSRAVWEVLDFARLWAEYHMDPGVGVD